MNPARVSCKLMMILPLLAAASCTRGADEVGHSQLRSDAASREGQLARAPDSVVNAFASAALEAFLDASRENSTTSSALDSLTECADAGASYFPTSLLATWTLLPFEARGDTVIARARVVTVAEQDIDRRVGGFVARQRIRSDVLEWDVYQTDDGRWVVCNGLRFGYIGADSLTEWRPEGTNHESSRRLADSLRSSLELPGN